jgi:hypothetical protein
VRARASGGRNLTEGLAEWTIDLALSLDVQMTWKPLFDEMGARQE